MTQKHLAKSSTRSPHLRQNVGIGSPVHVSFLPHRGVNLTATGDDEADKSKPYWP